MESAHAVYPKVICRKRKLGSTDDGSSTNASPFLKLKKRNAADDALASTADAEDLIIYKLGGTLDSPTISPNLLRKFSQNCKKQETKLAPVACHDEDFDQSDAEGNNAPAGSAAAQASPVTNGLMDINTGSYAYDYYICQDVIEDCYEDVEAGSIANIPIVEEEDFDDLDVSYFDTSSNLYHDANAGNRRPRHDEDSDSNAEDNWRNDYPDEPDKRCKGYMEEHCLLDGMMTLNMNDRRDELSPACCFRYMEEHCLLDGMMTLNMNDGRDEFASDHSDSSHGDEDYYDHY